MKAIGVMMAAWELWEKAMLPSLLSGAGTWVGITEKEIEKCDKLQDMFWRVMLEVPESCPKVALRAETRMIGMKHRIWEQKLLLTKRIKNLDPSYLSKRIYEEQRTNEWPGLVMEAKEICQELEIPDVNVNIISDRDIKRAVLEHHDRQLVEEVSKSKKMMKHKGDNFGTVQDYMKGKSIQNCRMAFRIRCELVKDIKGNFKDMYRKKGGEKELLCEDCDSNTIQTQSHCMECPQWVELRRGLEMSKIEDVVVFFQQMLKERLRRKSGS
jgi:hypothetical protein